MKQSSVLKEALEKMELENPNKTDLFNKICAAYQNPMLIELKKGWKQFIELPMGMMAVIGPKGCERKLINTNEMSMRQEKDVLTMPTIQFVKAIQWLWKQLKEKKIKPNKKDILFIRVIPTAIWCDDEIAVWINGIKYRTSAKKLEIRTDKEGCAYYSEVY